MFVNVPAGMNDGFWLKFTDAEGRAMYKKYASATAIDQNYKVNVSEFVPVNVDFNVSVSGFATSYSYYAANEGIEGIDSKDVNTANAVANDWMGAKQGDVLRQQGGHSVFAAEVRFVYACG